MITINGTDYLTVEEVAAQITEREGVTPQVGRKAVYRAIRNGWIAVAKWQDVWLLDSAAVEKITTIRAAGRGYDEPAQPERITVIGDDVLMTLTQASIASGVDARRIVTMAKEGAVNHMWVYGQLGIYPDQVDAIRSAPRKRKRTSATATGRQFEYAMRERLTPLQRAVVAMREASEDTSWDEIGKAMREKGLSKSHNRQTFEEAYRKGVSRREALRKTGVSEDVIMGKIKP